MAEFTGYKETSNRHLRFKLQSLSRRLDELEEATKNLQKAEDELLDLQDKVIQAEGSNSSMLADVEALRKRVLKIEGKDEEIRKAEELCRLMKEKLEEEESLTRELKSEIELLQRRMAELEKLEEAFSRSKNDCTQLCLSLNEEKNLTKKISTELDILRVKVKELEASEDRLDKSEQTLTGELEKLKSLALSFITERKHFNEREKQNEKIIQELTQKLEQNNKLNRADQTRNASNLLERSSNNLLDRNDLRIEDDLTSALPSKETRRKGSVDYLKHVENETRNKSENQKNKNQEDNKVKDLTQEIEKLKTQIKRFESLEEELKKMKAKNNDLQDSYLSEQNKNKLLTGQLEEIKMQIKKQKDLENGEVENEDTSFSSRGKHDRPKYRGVTADLTKHKTRELSPQQRRERARNRDFSNDSYSHGGKQVSSPSLMNRRAGRASGASVLSDTAGTDTKRAEEKSLVSPFSSGQKEGCITQNEGKRSKEQPSVLSRYPPAAQEQKSWKAPSKPGGDTGLRSKAEKPSQALRGNCHTSTEVRDEKSGKGESAASSAEKLKTSQAEVSECSGDTVLARGNHASSNGTASAYRYHLSSHGSASDSTGSKAEAANTSAGSHRQPSEGRARRAIISQEKEFADTSLESTKPSALTKHSHRSRSQEDILQVLTDFDKEDVERCSTSAVDHVNASLKMDSKTIQSNQEKLNSDEESGKSKKTTTQSDFETRSKIGSKQFSNSRGVFRASLFENDKNTVNEEDSTKCTKPPEASTGGFKSRRSFSPREALRSKAVIKPAIVEKDMKAIMGGTVSEAESDKQKSGFKTVTSKMTSSITIFPSEPTISRTSADTAAKERHVTTSNIRVAPNEPSPVTNHLPTPFEISINKSALKLSETDRIGEAAPRSKAETVVSRSSIVIKTSELTERSSEPASEAIGWKSHGFSDAASSETKHVTVRSSWRTRQGLHSLEDSQTKVEKSTASSTTNTCRSSVDLSEMEGNGARTNSLEQTSARTSATANSWSAPELGSRRTKSNLSASELLTRRSYASDPTTASAWHRSTTLSDENKDFAASSRRKQYSSSEYLSQADTPGKRPATKTELPDPESNPAAALGLQAEEQVCEFKDRPEKRV
ncbi:LUZP1 protein, partial [Trogon melanurus]|nr:LUZP1 protein [Trogon melanurus]